ncbi:MAG: AMP-binding protein [Planctomycetota bacterium]|nr:AMP-binding protein [Planctomycetota bacterium]
MERFAMKLSYDHGVSDIPLLGETMGEVFDRIAKEFATHEALVSAHENLRLTYGELAAEVERAARALLALGLQKGERVGVWSTNRSEWTVMQFAAAKAGTILVNINPAYRLHELEYALTQSGTSCLVLGDGFRDADYTAMLHELIPETKHGHGESLHAPRFPNLRHLVHLGKVGHAPAHRRDAMLSWKEFLARAGEVAPERLGARQADQDFDDLVNIQYTSGTTGSPKGAALTHHNIVNNAWWTAHKMRFTHQDRLCIPVPFYHCFGMVLANLACVTHGATMVLPGPYFSPLATLETCARERCTALHGVPTMFVAELQHPRFKEFDLSSLRTGVMAGAPCPIEVMNRVIEEMHCREILIGYGQTEASPLTNMTDPDDPVELRVGTVGRTMPHQEQKVVDPATGRTLPRGQQGELCFRGHHVMPGYYNNAEATRAAIDAQGWLHSGDLGVMDEAGYVRITGRLKDMIIRGGENIYPREIEEFLFTHPKIAEAYVFGVPDTFYGEQVMVWIRPREGVALSEDEIRAFCQGRIATFKIPKYMKFVTEFPTTVTGKVQKFRMREIATRELGLEGP